MDVRRLGARKEAIYLEALGDRKPLLCSGVQELLETLHKNDVWGLATPCMPMLLSVHSIVSVPLLDVMLSILALWCQLEPGRATRSKQGLA